MADRQRVETVDFARGIAAVGVMAYHVLYYEQIADLMKVSYYFVYAFFVISGFALYIRYRDGIVSIQDLRRYAASRVRRIAPLFWFAIVLHVALVDWPEEPWIAIPLNATLTFGFANPGSTSMLLGGWSIGIEMVFYTMAPLLIVFCRGSLTRNAIATSVSIALMVLFINFQLGGEDVMSADLWRSYIQPLSFFGYFAAGCFIGEIYIQHKAVLKGHSTAAILLALAIVVFLAVPVDSSPQMLRGWNGFALMLATISAVAAVVFIKEPKGYTLRAATWFGRLSYSTYLLHPILYVGIARPYLDSSFARIAFTAVATISLGTVVYYQLELRFRHRP